MIVSTQNNTMVDISDKDLSNAEIFNYIKLECKKNKLLPYDIKAHQGYLRHLMIRYGINTNEIMVNFVTSIEKPELLKSIAKNIFL